MSKWYLSMRNGNALTNSERRYLSNWKSGQDFSDFLLEHYPNEVLALTMLTVKDVFKFVNVERDLPK